MDFRNSGTRPWTTDASPHRLGSQNPRDSVTWGGSRASLPANEIRPGQTARFILALTAPANPGIYPLAAQMLEEGVEWFGETCATAVTVADDPTPAPAPSPAPAPNPSPAPAPNPGPMPTPAGQFRVSISYPGNVIYVGDVSFGSTTYAAGGQIYSLNSPRAIGTLIAAASDANLLYEIQPQAFGPFVRSINGYGPNGARGWLYAVNGQIPQVPSSDYVLNPGDEVRWFFGDADTSPY